MPDIGDAVPHHNLPAAGTIEVANLSELFRNRHCNPPPTQIIARNKKS